MKLRGAISGFGEVAARAHLPGWLAREAVDIRVVHDPISERRHEAIRHIKGVRVYDDLELMLDGEAPDFVDIASPPAFHAAAVRTALKAGAHVLIEKPMCLSLDEFDDLCSIARQTGRVLCCVHNWKYAPAYAKAAKLIAEGRLGAVRFISLDRLRTAPAGAGGSGGQWRASVASGGGILIDHGWHVFYLMQWLMGGEPALAISAKLGDAGESGAEQTADLRVSFPGGRLSGNRIARAYLSWRSPVRRTSALIYGETGMLEIEGDNVRLIDSDGRIETFSAEDAPDDSYHAGWFAGVASAFERAISEGPDSPSARVNLAEARNALALTIASRESSASGSEISLAR